MKQKEFKVESKLYNSLPNRSIIAIIIQLRTNHCKLNKYLHNTSAKNSLYCECDYEKEIVEYYLLECTKYKKQRKRMRLEIKKGRLTVGRLLDDPKMIKHTMKYVKDTARLEQ